MMFLSNGVLKQGGSERDGLRFRYSLDHFNIYSQQAVS